MIAHNTKIETIINDLRQGRMIILTDHPDRENEGDLVFPAEVINADIINFMIRHGSGIICLSLDAEQVNDIGLRMMVPFDENKSHRHTPFTVSIEAKKGITTGVSAADRATTILAALQDSARESIVSPGHVFPLQAKEGGVLERDGHTEGSIDLMKLAGLKSAAVICELMNTDGTMMQGCQIVEFAKENHINMISIEEIITHRVLTENLIYEEAISDLVLEKYGKFEINISKEKFIQNEHIILSKPRVNLNSPHLVRIHSSCMTGDSFGSMHCDCKAQLHHSLQRVSEEGGMLFYLPQEGRGIGLFNKIKAYALQENGFDTIEANVELNLPVDSREYYIVANILRTKHINTIRLLTNNPKKLNALKKYNIEAIPENMPVFATDCNKKYLLTKKDKLNHYIHDI